MLRLAFSFLLLSILLTDQSFAMDRKVHKGNGGQCSNCHSLTVTEANRLVKTIGLSVKSVKLSPVKGLFELAVEKDGRKGTAYIDFEKKHIMPGPVLSIASGKAVNQPPQKAPVNTRRVDVKKITRNYSIVMGNPKGKKKLFVFTDPDCPYCSKLHAELKKLVAMDKTVTVYIKLFPLQMHPKAYDKARVILARNSLNLLEKAFSGGALPPASVLDSRKPVDDTISLATSLGINETPTMVLNDGRVIAGTRDAATLQKLISGKM